ALQDYGRALIVGDSSTHGKGTVQTLSFLKPFMPGVTNDPGQVKITIRKFYRVSGASTQMKGVMSDLVLPDPLDYSDQVGEVALENPLPWDTIQPANYAKLNLVQPYLGALKARSDERVATNQDFLYVKQDIAQFQKMQADKTATINENESLKERKHMFTQNKTREAERIARKPDGGKIYEITVKNASEPGLVEFKPADETAATATDATTNATTTVATVIASTNNLGTNVIIQATKTGTANAVKPADADKKTPPPFDPMLEETQRILQDYILLLAKNGVLMAHD
ncbi:MAG TPA: carboxy terminal-processing peptidase, partial [Verrucomicrobiae bacterium]